MRNVRAGARWGAFFTAAAVAGVAAAQTAASPPEESGIGYPTVAAALEALRSRTDASVSVQGGWTIITAGPERSLWSFAPADHPAHPAVVRRTVVQKGGGVAIEMRALCQAAKAACDKLLDEFRQLNDRIREDIQRRSASAVAAPAAEAGTASPRQNIASTNADPAWRPTQPQRASVEATTRAYFAARDGNQIDEAYGFLSSRQRQQLPLDRYRGLVEDFNAKAGPVQARHLRALTWYKDTPQAGRGLFVAVDYASEFSNLALHCGYVVWHEQPDGSFLQVREEMNVIDRATMAKLAPAELEKLRAQFRC